MTLARKAGWQLFPANTFANGINYPWRKSGASDFYGRDFGTNPNTGIDEGVGTASDPYNVSTDLATLGATGGVRVVRWFVFGDCRTGVTFAGATPTGIQPQVYTSVDKLLTWAGAAGVQLDLSLF